MIAEQRLESQKEQIANDVVIPSVVQTGRYLERLDSRDGFLKVEDVVDDGPSRGSFWVERGKRPIVRSGSGSAISHP